MQQHSESQLHLQHNIQDYIETKYGPIAGTLLPLAEGSMNLNYLGETAVLHVGEEPNILQPSIAEAVLPHLYRDKGCIIVDFFRTIRLPSSDHVRIPRPLFCDSIKVDGRPFSLWAEERVHATNKPISELIYSQILDWLIELHKLNRHQAQLNLDEYYHGRLTLFAATIHERDCFDNVPLHEILSFMDDCIHSSIMPEERTGFVHGDLNRSNIITCQEGEVEKVAVIDFEKSPFPGDPLVDPLKLLKIKRLYTPPRHEEELNNEQRLRLILRYLKNSIAPPLTLQQIKIRDALVNLDTILSIYIARVHQPDFLSRGTPAETVKSYAAAFYADAKKLTY